MKIKTLIVEDEPVARRRIKRFLANDAEVEIVGEAADGRTAVRMGREKKPDLLLLDIQIPELNGFEVIAELAQDSLPEIIFTTAFDEYALTAFDIHAIDYLVKPFDRERFEFAVNRAKKLIRRGQTIEDSYKIFSLLEDLRSESESGFAKRIVVKTHEEILLLKPAEIDWIEASGDYLRIHIGKQVYLLRETLRSLESKLDPKRFLRIRRSIIVSTERVSKLHPLFRGSYVVELESGLRLTSSRSHRERLQRFFDKSL